VTPFLQGVDLGSWRETIDNTELHNSALRISRLERQSIEDLVILLRRKYGIKTSMNELARIGLLVLAHDVNKRDKKSIIHRVKKS